MQEHLSQMEQVSEHEQMCILNPDLRDLVSTLNSYSNLIPDVSIQKVYQGLQISYNTVPDPGDNTITAWISIQC